jgi:4-diphosphocytidyl-2-C-methyl-D-erythritol kinase
MPLRALYDVPAPAKLNLFLHVIGRRADGYHLLQSPFVLVDWCDTLHFERRDDGALVRHDLGPALPADDLSLRAARALQAASGTPLGAEMHVLKRVPWGAGLGGGSSDAATTLLALNRLWGLGWPRARLAALALTLGADVPFFVGGHNAFVEGIGERLRPLTLPRGWYAVVHPAVTLPTAAVFSHPLLKRDTGPVIVAGLSEDSAGESSRARVWHPDQLDFGGNDLQHAAQAVAPEVGRAAAFLAARFGNSRMTGSGSAVFSRAGTGDAPSANLAAEDLPPGWVGRMCRSLDSHPLVGWAG